MRNAILLIILTGCVPTGHPVRSAGLGKTAAAGWTADLSAPGVIEFETIVAADWAVDRSGLINLDHPTSQAAGLEDGSEPIKIFMHVLRHPEHGLFIVDSGVDEVLATRPEDSHLSGLIQSVMNMKALDVHVTTKDWLANQSEPLRGVFLTHLHLDHVLGLPDVPNDVPIYAGAGENEGRAFVNAFVKGTFDDLLDGHGPLRLWEFANDAEVVDVFSDGSVFAVHAPGHTRGNTSYVVRTTKGPVLLLGDSCHTRWGWDHGVEPGTFSGDLERSVVSMQRLQELAATTPDMRVVPGHQF